MIFYFTGTGNSLQVAKNIGNHNNEDLISISSAMQSGKKSYEYTLKNSEKIGFVFPVYAWGPPKIVLDFIEKLKLNNLNNNYVFAISTCGENIGNTMKILGKRLKKRDLILHSGFSISMPNNYMVMGMDVDSPEESEKKLLKVEDILKDINHTVESRQKNVFKVEKGMAPTLLTAIINPMFNIFSINPKKFYAKDHCISCKICEKVCNTQTIKVDKKPRWGDQCTQCLACINLYPVKAIEYGKATINKGRYKNPNIRIEDLEHSL